MNSFTSRFIGELACSPYTCHKVRVIGLSGDSSDFSPQPVMHPSIVEKIIKTASSYGIQKKDIVFDTLTMTVSANSDSPNVTLGSLKYIKDVLGCHTSLGVSNVSFGLPNRDVINSTFFAMALENGLSAAIMNPYSTEMLKAYHAYLALSGKDENCASYVNFATALPVAVS